MKHLFGICDFRLKVWWMQFMQDDGLPQLALLTYVHRISAQIRTMIASDRKPPLHHGIVTNCQLWYLVQPKTHRYTSVGKPMDKTQSAIDGIDYPSWLISQLLACTYTAGAPSPIYTWSGDCFCSSLILQLLYRFICICNQVCSVLFRFECANLLAGLLRELRYVSRQF